MSQGHRLFVSVLTLAAGILTLSLALRSANPQPATAGCRYETAVGVPSWVPTGGWQGRKLLVVDVAGRRLIQVSDTGVASELHTALGHYMQAFSPIRIREGGPNGSPNLLLELAGGRLVEVDRNLTPRRTIELAVSGLKSTDKKSIAMLIDWVWAGQQVIGYADLWNPEEDKGPGSWKNGFVRFNVTQPDSFSIIHEQAFPDNARASMTLTYPLLASIGTTGYVALVDGRMGLWRFGPGDLKLQPMERAFPEKLAGKLAPQLPNWVQREEFPGVMAAVERESMPAGLWAWKNSLFLLFRTFENGQRRWFLSKIDPAQNQGKGGSLWTVQVPGSADHMTVIPGPDEWAFLEKGPVTGWLNQETHHILFVTSARLRASSLPSLCP